LAVVSILVQAHAMLCNYVFQFGGIQNVQ